MKFELKQIFLPNPNINNVYVDYENKLQPRMIFGDESIKEFFEKRRNEILEIVVREITEYVNDDDACNDEIDMFPRRCEMTGEWYIGCIYFDDIEYLSIDTCFLGFYPESEIMPVNDYLELEVFLMYDESQDKFIFNGINSACI